MKDHSDTVSAATRDHFGTMFVALELSGKSWLAAVWAPDKDQIGRHGLAAGEAAALLRLIARVRARAARRLGR